jgi:hypothetical protein
VVGIEKEDFLMNKNHLLPALLFVLAACGGTVASSTPSSSSVALDTNEYRMIGGQANIGAWAPVNATIMTRTAGTNSYSWTGDLYKDATWKIVIGTSWANGQISPKSAGVTITDKGVPWTKDQQGVLVIPQGSNTSTVDDGNDGLNFQTLVEGSYTITLVSLPALSRTLNIVRNGNPVIAPPSITDWALVGTINGWNEKEKSFKLANDKDENKLYSLTLNLYQDELFKFVKNGAWGGDLGYSTVVDKNAADIADSGGNIKIVRDGSFSVTLNVGTTTTATVTRVGEAVRTPGGFHLVGTVQTTAWKPDDRSLALTEVGSTGKFYGVFTIAKDKEFKVKTGTTWNEGNDPGFDAGFDKVASFPAGAIGAAGSNIKVLVETLEGPNANKISHTFLIDVRVVGGSVRLAISPAWRNFGFKSMEYTPATGTSIGYENTTGEFWTSNAQMSVYGFNGSNTKVNFEYTGVAGHQYIFKIEHKLQLGGGVNREARSVATGAKQTFVLDVSTLSADDRAKLSLLIVFNELPNTGTALNPITGTFVIHNVYFSTPS